MQLQENKEGLELLKTAISKAGYEGKVSSLDLTHHTSCFFSCYIVYFKYSFLKVVIGMDVAASEFYGKDKTYDLNFKEEASFLNCRCSWLHLHHVLIFDVSSVFLQNNNGSQKIPGDKLKDLYKSFVNEYPIVSIEDPFDQDDWGTYAKLTTEIGDKVQIVGDDLLVTNPKVIELCLNTFMMHTFSDDEAFSLFPS